MLVRFLILTSVLFPTRITGIFYALCIILAFTESYGLRLRHVICGCYYPAQEKVRAVWLYNRILRSRGSITKFLRRKIRQKIRGDDTLEKITLIDRLTSQLPLFERIAKKVGFIKIHCLCCNEPGDPDDHINFKRCGAPGCKGVYCYSCFAEIKNVCTLCMNPVEYGDLSDVSEERDSSEKDEPQEILEEELESSNEEPEFDYQYEKGSQPISEDELREALSRLRPPFRSFENEGGKNDLASLSDFSDRD